MKATPFQMTVGQPFPGILPLSVELDQVLADFNGQSLTLNQLLVRTAARGPYGFIILLSLPFMIPISLPGVSNLFGVIIVYLAWRLCLGFPPKLPSQFGDRNVQSGLFARALRAGVRVLRWVERWVRPRHSQWIRTRAGRMMGASGLALGGIMLALPLPPTIPLSNFIPAVAIVVLAASMMEEDGWVIWLGYLTTLASAAYLSVMIALHLEFFRYLLRSAIQWCAS